MSKELRKIWQEKVTKKKGPIKSPEEIEKLTQELYQASPRRLRDKWLITTKRPTQSFNFREVYEKYFKHNPFSATKPHYRQAIYDFLRSKPEQGEELSEQEIAERGLVDKKGQVILGKGDDYIVSFGDRPGRGFTIRRHEPKYNLSNQVKKHIHDSAHSGYIEKCGTELEKKTWQQKQNSHKKQKKKIFILFTVAFAVALARTSGEPVTWTVS